MCIKKVNFKISMILFLYKWGSAFVRCFFNPKVNLGHIINVLGYTL